jgi:hypothetical protein
MKITTGALVCFTVALISILGILAVIILQGRDITGFLLAVTTVGSSLAILLGVNRVVSQTNGTLSKALTDKDAVVAENALLKTVVATQSVPTPATDTAIALSPTPTDGNLPLVNG